MHNVPDVKNETPKRVYGYYAIQKDNKRACLIPVETVCLSFYGESLLHRQFSEFLQIAKSAGLNVFFSTNGSMLTQDASWAIIENRLDLLIISYDTVDEMLYRKIRGGDLSVLNRNVERFLRLKGRRLPLTVLQCIEFPDFPKQKERIIEQWKDFDVEISVRPAHDWLGDIPEMNQIAKQGMLPDYGVCDQPWRHAVIYWDGRVGPCCNFYDAQISLGNLNDNSLRDIWNGKYAEGFRKKHVMLQRNRIKGCAFCKQKEPNLLENLILLCFDMAQVNTYLSMVDGWRN